MGHSLKSGGSRLGSRGNWLYIKKLLYYIKNSGGQFFFVGLAVFILPKKRPRFDQKLPTGTSEQSSGGRLAKMWTRIVSIEPTCASRVLNDLGTTLFPLKLSYGEIDTKLELNSLNFYFFKLLK
jgi:hypothetical protein